MNIDANLKRFTEQCLRAIGLGPIFRCVIKHDANFDVGVFARFVVKPMAHELGFVCKHVELSSFNTKQDVAIELREIQTLLHLCGDERRPLLIFQNTELLLRPHFYLFHTQIRNLLDCFDTTAVLFLSSDKKSIYKLFSDSTMPFYCSAAILELTNGKQRSNPKKYP